MRDLAAERGYNLAKSYAYTDSITDLPMLEIVGHPTAVNPDEDLRRIAEERQWAIQDFARPVAMKSRSERRQAVAAAGAGAAIGAVALGITWYARHRKG
jgi:hypothetical protein